MSVLDVLLQLYRDIIQPTVMRYNDKAILALNFRSASDNLHQGSILVNLSFSGYDKAFAKVRASGLAQI